MDDAITRLDTIERHLSRRWPSSQDLVTSHMFAKELAHSFRTLLTQYGEQIQMITQATHDFLTSADHHGHDEDAMNRVLLGLAYEDALEGREPNPVVRKGMNLHLKEGKTKDAFKSALASIGYHPVFGNVIQVLYAKPNWGMLQLTWRGEDASICYSCRLSEQARTNELVDEYFDPATDDEEHIGNLYALIRDQNDLLVTSVGAVGVALVRHNYTPDILRSYPRVCDQLQKEDPDGRLLLLDGPPGVGKTFFIRGLMRACEGAKFMVAMPDVLTELASPQMLPALMREVAGSSDKVVLVIEDDALLRKRDSESGNLSQISALLNMSEGLLGAALDLRIVVTTNTAQTEIDPAVVRSGRMLEHLRFRKMTIGEAEGMCRHMEVPITKGMWNDEVQIPLSDIYKYARSRGWRSEPTAQEVELKPTCTEHPPRRGRRSRSKRATRRR